MIIQVKVKPNSGKSYLERIEGEYVAYLKEKAEDGKANKALIGLISREFGVDFRKVKIKNPKSRKKVIEIDDKK